jgi:hypothetical protein
MMDPTERGIRGNSHMIMQDRNSFQIADLIAQWLDDAISKEVWSKKNFGSARTSQQLHGFGHCRLQIYRHWWLTPRRRDSHFSAGARTRWHIHPPPGARRDGGKRLGANGRRSGALAEGR